MLNMNKCICIVTFILIFMFSLSVSAMATTATPAVNYDAVSEGFIFDTKGDTPTDLFVNFKDAMPGDTLTQEIVLTNNKSNEMGVKFFLKSLGADEASKELLSKMKLTVTTDSGSKLFDAPVDQTATLTDWNELGLVYPGGNIKLNLTLSIPATLGNEFQNAKGNVKWAFKSEEQAVPKSPTTGDDSNVYLYVAVLACSLLALTLVISNKRRINKQL